MSLLEVHGLAKAFGGIEAARDVSFAVDAGEMVAVIGPNGAGKSTVFNMINGQLAPDAGRVVFAGETMTGLVARQVARRGLGRTFQVAQCFRSMSALENVQMALIAHAGETGGLWRRAGGLHAEEAAAMIERVGLKGQEGRAAAVLAYGDVKRLELAMALATRPKLLLMDEPTAGMAPGERRDLMRLVAGLSGESGIAVLFTEHDMEAVFGHAARVVVMDRGAVIASGTPDEVRADEEVKRVYLGSEPSPGGEGGAERAG